MRTTSTTRRAGLTAVLTAGCLVASGLAATAADASPTARWLYYGSRGPGVLCVQQVLKYEAGHPQLVEDGIFGVDTQNAVMDLQRFFSMQVDGVVGPQTGDMVKFVAFHNDIWYGPLIWGSHDCENNVPTSH